MRHARDALGNQAVAEVSRRLQSPALALDVRPAALIPFRAGRADVACVQAVNLPPHKSASVVDSVGRDPPATIRSRGDDCRRRARGDR